jgi:formamidopyrimidine-DNA glycosylase
VIELPESNIIAQQLNETIKGKMIQNVLTNSSPHKFAWFFGDPDKYCALLSGKRIDGAKAYAGQIEIQAEDTRILFGDGVNIRFFNIGEKLPEKHQLFIEFDDYSSLIGSIQMYGGLWAYRDGENDNPYYIVAKQKPNPLSGEFDRNYFDKLVSDSMNKTISLKGLLATEQRIPGLGNGVLQDILYNAKLHPKRKLQSLNNTELDSLYESVKATLFEMYSMGGRDTEKDLFGCSGGYKTKLSKNTVGKACPVCGTVIQKEAYMGGSIYYCGTCQQYEK